MSEKKDRILRAARQLFATEGYHKVPTSRVAREAGVSEGLIFRHFGHKKGLLDALMADTEEQLQRVFREVIAEADPQKVIEKTLRIPFEISEDEYDFWTLQFKLKWDAEYNHSNTDNPIVHKLEKAFDQLQYSHPAFEARLLYQIIDGIAMSILRDGQPKEAEYLDFLLRRYQ